MSTSVYAPPTGDYGDFNRIAFDLVVDGLDPANAPARRHRPSRQVTTREAIDQSLGIRRHRSNEREA